MNSEEFEELLKDIPITNNMISSYSSINVEDIRKAINRFKYVPSYRDLLEENNQLKEEIKKYINSSDFVYDELYKKREKIEKILGGKE